MDEPLEEYVRALPRRPDCLVTNACNPWTAGVYASLDIPRPMLHCPSAYSLFTVHNLSMHGVYDRVADELETFEVPDFPVHAVGNKATFRSFFMWPGVEKEHRDMLDAEATADGLLISTFRAIESVFIDGYATALGRKTSAVGPTCTSSMDAVAKASRGNRTDVDVGLVVAWLDARPPGSVQYISFGNIVHLRAKQVIELARGLEASGRPFVWAIKEAKIAAAVRALLNDKAFEEKNN